LRGFAAALGVPAPRLKVAVASEEDWLERWKEFFVPVAIGETLLVRPPWAAGEREGGRKEVVIRPGLAFGTGLHATTKMCLEFLAETVKGGERVVDVGAGSGVLSIAACKLGAEVAVAVDNDPVALRECRRNCAENGVLGRVLILGGSLLSALRGRQDLLVCNIEAGAACEVARRGNEALKARGCLILAGFTSEREAEVSRALVQGGFLLEGRRQEGPWVSFSARGSSGLRPGTKGG
jgi:ribosomal protein L11 methyltransferase